MTIPADLMLSATTRWRVVSSWTCGSACGVHFAVLDESGT